MSADFAQDAYAMQAIYLMIGAEKARNVPGPGKAKQHQEGHMGQAQLCADFAEVMMVFLASPALRNVDFPGVFNYEVTEAMGGWLMHNQTATKNAFRVELDRVYLEFMSQ